MDWLFGGIFGIAIGVAVFYRLTAYRPKNRVRAFIIALIKSALVAGTTIVQLMLGHYHAAALYFGTAAVCALFISLVGWLFSQDMRSQGLGRLTDWEHAPLAEGENLCPDCGSDYGIKSCRTGRLEHTIQCQNEHCGAAFKIESVDSSVLIERIREPRVLESVGSVAVMA